MRSPHLRRLQASKIGRSAAAVVLSGTVLALTPILAAPANADVVVPVVNVSDASVTEGDSGQAFLHFHVTLDQATTATVSLHVATADGTATVADNDYQAQSIQVTYLPGATDASITVPVVGDTTFEPDETLTLTASNLANASAGDLSGVGTIVNDDLAPIMPVVNVSDATVVEGDSGFAFLQFHVSLAQATALTVSMNVATADGTATVADGDYQPQNLTLTYLPGATDTTISVPVVGDTKVEPDETLSLNLSNFTNATAGDASGVGTIVDDDTPPVVSVSDATVVEGDSGTTNLGFTVSLDHAFSKAVSMQATTADGTATAADGDYQPQNLTITFLPGTTTTTVDVPVDGDLVSEPDETLSLNLSGVTNGTLGDASGTGTIRNDDAAVNWTAASVSTPEGNTGTTALALTATLTNAVDTDVDAPVVLTNGTATKGSDFLDLTPSATLHFAAGTTERVGDRAHRRRHRRRARRDLHRRALGGSPELREPPRRRGVGHGHHPDGHDRRRRRIPADHDHDHDHHDDDDHHHDDHDAPDHVDSPDDDGGGRVRGHAARHRLRRRLRRGAGRGPADQRRGGAARLPPPGTRAVVDASGASVHLGWVSRPSRTRQCNSQTCHEAVVWRARSGAAGFRS